METFVAPCAGIVDTTFGGRASAATAKDQVWSSPPVPSPFPSSRFPAASRATVPFTFTVTTPPLANSRRGLYRIVSSGEEVASQLTVPSAIVYRENPSP